MMTEQSKRRIPDSWVERIFDRMQGLYGSLWVDRWRSGELIARDSQSFDRGLLLAKETWAQELGGFVEMPERISRALDACRHRNLPPTLPEFLDACRQQHADAPKALAAPRATAEQVAQQTEVIARRMSAPQAGGTAWAETPPASGARGSMWERDIIELAEAGEPRFLRILARHVEHGVIRSDRARAALESAGHADAA